MSKKTQFYTQFKTSGAFAVTNLTSFSSVSIINFEQINNYSAYTNCKIEIKLKSISDQCFHLILPEYTKKP